MFINVSELVKSKKRRRVETRESVLDPSISVYLKQKLAKFEYLCSTYSDSTLSVVSDTLPCASVAARFQMFSYFEENVQYSIFNLYLYSILDQRHICVNVKGVNLLLVHARLALRLIHAMAQVMLLLPGANPEFVIPLRYHQQKMSVVLLFVIILFQYRPLPCTSPSYFYTTLTVLMVNTLFFRLIAKGFDHCIIKLRRRDTLI